MKCLFYPTKPARLASRGHLKPVPKARKQTFSARTLTFLLHPNTQVGNSYGYTDGENKEKTCKLFVWRHRKDPKVSVGPYLSVSERRRYQLSRRETGVPTTDGKVYPCFKACLRVESVTVFPWKSFFSPRVSLSSPPSSVFFSSLFSGLLFLLLSWIQPPHFLLSTGSLFSLPTGSRGHYTSFHAEWASARERERGREAE